MKQKLTLLLLALVTSIGARAQVTALSDINQSKCYTVTCNRSSWAVANNGTSLTTISQLGLAFSSTDAKQQFAFVAYNDKYYLWSVNANKFVTSSNTLTDVAAYAEPVYFADASSHQANTVRVYFNASKNINVGGSKQITIDTWSTADDGCSYTIAEAADFDPTAALNVLNTPSLRYVISDDSGVIYASDFFSATTGETITTLPSEYQRSYCNYTVTPTTIQAGENTVNVTVTYDLPFEVGTGKKYLAKLRGHYVYYDETNSDVRTNQTSKEYSDNYFWCFYGNPYSGIKVKNAASGTYLDNTSTTVQLSAEGYSWTIVSLNSTSTFGLYNGANYINEQNKGNHNLIYYSLFSNDTGSQWTVELPNDYLPEIPSDKYLSIGEKVNTFTVSASATDNDHWYILTQTRDGETPVYNAGTGSTLKRTATSITTLTLDNASAISCTAYLVRFVSAGEGLYNIQFADGQFINSSLESTGFRSEAAAYAFYNTVAGGTTFGWNLNDNTRSIVDNNGAGSKLVFYGSGTVTATSGNNVWSIYPVSFSDALVYPFSTTDGAFFSLLNTNMPAADGNYCNLWLSKATANKPQLKLITGDASTSRGNNMRSSGGLYTTANPYQYNLSISEGKITSYTIVGTAKGALSITPADGSAEEFAAEASVSKKVTLDTPAKQTSFTLSGSSQWLNIEKFIIEWETDATAVNSVSDVTSDGIYTLAPHNAERGVLYAGESYLDACGGHANTNYPANKSTAIDATDPNQQFALYTHGGNTYLYSIGRGKFVGVANGLYYRLTGAPVNTWTLSDGFYGSYFHLTSTADSKMATLNAWVNTGGPDSKDYAITGNSANEEANNFMLRRVGTLTDEQVTAIETIFTNYETLQGNLTTLGNYTVGSELSQYSNANLATDEAKEEKIANVQEKLKACEVSDITTKNEEIENLISSMSINMPAANAFYRIKAGVSEKYVTGTPSSYLSFLSLSETPDNTTIIYLDGDKLLNYSKGLYSVNTSEQAAVGITGDSFTFAGSANRLGYYTIYSTTSSGYMYDSGNTEGRGCVDRQGRLGGDNTDWTLEPVTSLPITMHEAGGAYYGTINLPVAVTLPEGLMAYSAVADGEVLTLKKVVENGVLAANQPVILYSEADVTELAITTGGTGAGSNELSGTIAAETVAAGENYVLGMKSSEVGFYLYNNTEMPGFKAYLPKASTSNVRAFTFSFNDVEDAIRAIENEDSNLDIYDVAGRRVQKAQKGLYIVNGKKVMFK